VTDGFAVVWLVVATLAGVLVTPQRFRPSVLLFGSYTFLALWSLPGLGVLCCVTAIAYLSGRAVEAQRSSLVTGVCIGATLLPLCLLRFMAPGASGLGVVAGGEGVSGLLLPFGLSFFTLQAVGYVLDVRLSRIPAERRCTPLALYLAFFPKLLAGPIERASAFIPQLPSIRFPRDREIVRAGKCILLGLFAKYVLADALARVGAELSQDENAGGAIVALSCLAYSYEIYLDFFGYSIIAIGVGRLLGLELSDNFRTPYAARSLQEFWRRWHMTLSFWFRDYVYKPLGGSRTSESKRWVVVMLVFLFSGLWHGQAATFLVWGGLHGALYLIGTSTLGPRRRAWEALGLLRAPTVHRLLQTAVVFLAATVAWVFFRSPNVSEALNILSRATGFASGDYLGLGGVGGQSVFLALGLLLAVAILDASRFLEVFPQRTASSNLGWVGELVALDAMLLALLLFGSGGGQSFIYFSF